MFTPMSVLKDALRCMFFAVDPAAAANSDLVRSNKEVQSVLGCGTALHRKAESANADDLFGALDYSRVLMSHQCCT